MIKDITWPEKNQFSDPDHNTHFLGRNGMGKCAGVQITDFNHKSVGQVRIDPITRQSVKNGRPYPGRAWIEFPADYAAQVADAIREAAGLFPVSQGVICAKCGADPVDIVNDNNMVYSYICPKCQHEGEASYEEIITEIT